jgi:DNA polymerase-3 subunit delta'
MNMYWLDKHLAQWRTSISSDHKPQAVIISGHQGMGKRALLDQILADLLCQQAEQACGACQNCRLQQLGSHPDIKRLLPEKHLIKVSMVREITGFFTSTPHCSAHKVAVIEQAHLMNTAAANALLKILEEPPASGVLFLLTEHKQRLMPTIKSRCVELNVRLDTDEEHKLADWVASQTDHPSEAIQAALQLTDHQPLTSLRLLQEEQLSVINQQLDVFHQVLSGQASVSAAAKQLSEVEDPQIWQHLQRHFLQLIKSQLGAENAEINTNHPLNQFVKKAPKVIHILIELTDLIRSVMLNLNTQIKKQLLIESVLIEIKKPFYGGR